MTEQTGKTNDTTAKDNNSAEQSVKTSANKTNKNQGAEVTEGSSKVRVGAIGKYWMENDKFERAKDVKLWDGCGWYCCGWDDVGKDTGYKLVEVAKSRNKKLILRAPVQFKANPIITDDLLIDGGDTLLFYAGTQKKWKNDKCFLNFFTRNCWVRAGGCCDLTDDKMEDVDGKNNERLVVTYMTPDAMFQNEADDIEKIKDNEDKKKRVTSLSKKRKETFEAIEGIAAVLARYMLEEKDGKRADLSKMTLKHTDAIKIFKQYNKVATKIREDNQEVTWKKVKKVADETTYPELCKFAEQDIEESNPAIGGSEMDIAWIIVFGVLLLLLAILVFLKKTGKLSSLRILQQTGPRSEDSSVESSEAVGYLACTIFSLLAALTMGFLRRSSMHRKIASHVIDIEMERPFANEV